MAAIISLGSGCSEDQVKEQANEPQATLRNAHFVDRAREAGLDFTYLNGMTGRYYLLEVMGGGAALFDLDNDGDLDLYIVQGGSLDDGRAAIFPDDGSGALGDRLFRNDSESQSSPTVEPRFTDVTEQSGIRATGYGMGVTAGDFNNDGWIDLYVSNWGANQMLRNNGVGTNDAVTFTDVTQETATGDDHWSVASVFFDFDRDGWLDLYIGNYVDFSLSIEKVCTGFGASEDYCGPAAYPAQPDRLLRNSGADGSVTFTDVTTEAGLRREPAPALGAVAADFDDDGWLDLYVANDQAENFLWMHQGEAGRVAFVDRALLSGCAVSAEGKAEASMGVDVADFDHDGDLDLFVTHLTGESNTLYVNDGGDRFTDATIGAGLDAASWSATGFGAAWMDYDGDGWLDLMTANGAVHRIEQLHRQGELYPLRQPNQLFRNLDGGGFEQVSATAGPALTLSEVSRGLAAGDIDNDGDIDTVIVNSNSPARLLVNQSPQTSHWLGLRVIEHRTGRDALGARVGLHRPDQPIRWRRVHPDGSYASSNDPRILFHLGDSTAPVRLEVRWPDGSKELWDELAIDRYTTLRQGTRKPPSSAAGSGDEPAP